MKTRKHTSGFTLIELMVTVTIIGILAAIALPTYTSYIERGHRTGAKTVLLEAAQFMERYRAINFRYVDSVGVAPALPTALTVSPTPTQGAKRYDVGLTGITTATSFILTATPFGWADTACGNLTLTNLGVKGQSVSPLDVSVTATCWNR